MSTEPLQPPNSLATSFANFYETNIFTDLILHSGTQTFNVHRGVLASKSEWFLKACTNGFQETITRTITLHDDREEVAEMIHFCYYGTYKGGSLVNDVKMFALGEKYLMPSLQEYAVQHIRKTLEGIELLLNEDMSNWKLVIENQVDFVTAVRNSYDICLDPERKLRGVFIDYGVDHADATFFSGRGSKFLRDMLKDVPEYAADMFELMGQVGVYQKGVQEFPCTTEGCGEDMKVRPSQLKNKPNCVIELGCGKCKVKQSHSWTGWIARARSKELRVKMITENCPTCLGSR